MKSLANDRKLVWPAAAWLSVVVTGFALPITAILSGSTTLGAPVEAHWGPVFAIGLMGAGIIGAAAARRFAIGLLIALGAGLVIGLIGSWQSWPSDASHAAVGAAIVIASISFAARGALFAVSAEGRGWLIGLAVVLGEAAIIATSAIEPGSIPQWLLVLLPAQWASTAIQATLAGSLTPPAIASLAALAGTAAGTGLVAKLWPRRWPYLIMASTWLSFSAVVWYVTTSQGT